MEGFLYFNAFVFACAVGFFSWTLLKKYKVLYAVTGSLGIIVSPLFIFASRNPGNANTYLAIALIILSLLHFYKLTGKSLAVIGFLTGVIVNFQYANIVIFIPLSLYLFFKLRNKKLFFYYIIPFFVSFLPLFLFELRHDFVMTKNTLFSGSYKGFIENSQLGTAQVKRNIIEQVMFISYQIGGIIGISPLIALPAIGLFIVKFQKGKRDYSWFLFVMGIYVLTLFSLQFQFADHYVYPAAICILFAIIVFVIKQNQIVLLGLLLIFQVLLLPPIFENSQRPYWFYKNVVEKAISDKIVKKQDSFNIIQIRPETAITPLGFEYRYFFILNGYYPRGIQNYNESEQLLIFSRVSTFDISQLNSWEMQQFGDKYKSKATKVNINGVEVYSLMK